VRGRPGVFQIEPVGTSRPIRHISIRFVFAAAETGDRGGDG